MNAREHNNKVMRDQDPEQVANELAAGGSMAKKDMSAAIEFYSDPFTAGVRKPEKHKHAPKTTIGTGGYIYAGTCGCGCYKTICALCGKSYCLKCGKP